MKNNKTLSKLNSYIAGNRKYLILVIISALLANIFMLVAPYISGRAIDFIKGENNVDFPMVAKIIGILFAVYVLNALFTWGMTVFTNALSNHSIEKMRKDAFGKISKLPLKFFDGHSHGDIISRSYKRHRRSFRRPFAGNYTAVFGYRNGCRFACLDVLA